MSLLDLDAALRVELLALYILFALVVTRALDNTHGHVKGPRWAPSLAAVRASQCVLSVMAGSAAYLVRIVGGAWIGGGNERQLFVFFAWRIVRGMSLSFPCLPILNVVLT